MQEQIKNQLVNYIQGMGVEDRRFLSQMLTLVKKHLERTGRL